MTNYDESKVPTFKLPDALTTFDGDKIGTAQEWNEIRRPELYSFFETQVYGKVPEKLDISGTKVLERSGNALNGKATRRQVQLTFNHKGQILSFVILLYLPKNVDKAPIFLGYNFFGNHTVSTDTDIIVPKAWTRNSESLGITDHTPSESARGVRSNRWPIEKLIDAGHGLATIYYGEVAPDRDDYEDGVQPLLYGDGQNKPKPDEWGKIAAWAWGYGRALDYLENQADIDASRIVVFGHSRLGKAALWAGATDARFAGVISNDSGCGGAALSKRKFGETIGKINASFPLWFCENFKNYNNNEEALPVDQHELLALIAPRPLYVASAVDDRWADPRGEFLSAYYATEVFALFGINGIGSKEMPKPNAPVGSTVSYHIRTGKHDVTDYDWEQYIIWADAWVK
ncbi:acetylxylan esterase [Flavobacteriaceae bacterium F89]|uniref:Acetylxylan esterase n=1 Tax=Cerina litoralis TaxID=2874477 RepID=A0AAE3ERJ5_9FLAO|nr:acetylxylan esterase [Cerina litoralis]MCG2459800.1 acetylxylan esterase [Cerina litoralis]